MIRLLLTGISGEFSGNFRFSRRSFKLLVKILWFFLFFFDNIQICIQFFNLQQLLLSYNFLGQKFYVLYVHVPENNVSCTLLKFFFYCSNFFLSNLIHNLQTTLISTKYSQKNKNNNIKLNSTSTVPYILL